MAKTKPQPAKRTSYARKIGQSDRRTKMLKQLNALENARAVAVAAPDTDVEAKLSIQRIDSDMEEIKAGLNKYNAKKIEIDGILFDSTLEGYFYTLLKESGLNFIMQHNMILQPSFRHEGVLIQKIVLRIDFVVENHFLVDTKGQHTEKGKLKWKMLLFKYGGEFEFLLPRNRKQCEEYINYIIERLGL